MRALIAKPYAFARWLVVLEIGIWRSLFLWVTRRVPGSGPGVQQFAYSRDVTPLLVAFIFVSVLEIVAVHLLLPWPAARSGALIVGIWGLLWMAGYLASMRVFPHLVGDAGLRVRSGTRVDVSIPWEAVAQVRAQRGRVTTNRSVQIEDGEHGDVVSVAMLKQTKVSVVFTHPIVLELPGGAREVGELRLYADNPGRLVAAARARLPLRALR